MAQNKIIKKINVNIENCEKIIKDKKAYNKKVKLIKKYSKAGIVTSYLIPYVIALPMLSSVKSYNGDNPFKREITTEPKVIEVIDTSNGTHIEHISDDYEYDDTNLEYSTGWKINDDGLYERELYEYNIDNYNLDDIEKIFAMSKEEADKTFDIETYKTICKKTLEPEDYYYDEDGFVITNHIESNEMVSKKESISDYVFNILGILLSTFFVGSIVCIVDDKLNLSCKKFRKKMEKYQNSYEEVCDYDVEKAKKLLDIYQSNMALLNDSYEEDDEYKHFVLRRK
jgi:hypothetical protein